MQHRSANAATLLGLPTLTVRVLYDPKVSPWVFCQGIIAQQDGLVVQQQPMHRMVMN